MKEKVKEYFMNENPYGINILLNLLNKEYEATTDYELKLQLRDLINKLI